MNNASLLIGKTIDALDGKIGSVHDVYFDDQTWSLRYLVVDIGKWLPGRKVLVVPEAIVKPILFLVLEVNGWLFGKKVLAGPSLISRVDWTTSTVHVDANRQALKNAQEYNPAA